MTVAELTTVTEKQTNSAKILQRTVCLVLERHYLGNTRKIDVEDLVEVAGGTMSDATERQITATKKLIDTKELRPCMNILARTQRVLRKIAIPSHSVFGERTYLIPLENIERAESALTTLQAELFAEAAALATRYTAAVDAQEQALGPKLFRRGEYLPSWKVAKAFSIDWSYVSFASPEHLESISSVLAKKSNEKYLAKLADAYDEARQTVRQTALATAQALVKKLSDGKRGPKAVRGTALNDLKEFVENYQSLNVTDDVELDAVMVSLRALAEGTEVEDLREFDQVRARVIAQAQEAVGALEVLTTERALNLDGDL